MVPRSFKGYSKPHHRKPAWHSHSLEARYAHIAYPATYPVQPTKQPTTHQDRFLARGRLSIFHITLLDKLQLGQGLRRCYIPIYATILLRIETDVKCPISHKLLPSVTAPGRGRWLPNAGSGWGTSRSLKHLKSNKREPAKLKCWPFLLLPLQDSSGSRLKLAMCARQVGYSDRGGWDVGQLEKHPTGQSRIFLNPLSPRNKRLSLPPISSVSGESRNQCTHR